MPRRSKVSHCRVAVLDGCRLSQFFVDAQHEAAFHQFRIDIALGSGQHQGHRSSHFMPFNGCAARTAFFAGGHDRQVAFTLQELERVTGITNSGLFGDGQDLMPQVHVGRVVQTLAGHGTASELVFRWHEAQDGIHQRRFSGSRR